MNKPGPKRPCAAEVVCVGSELLAGKLNTHLPYLSRRLAEAGLVLRRESTVGDEVPEIASAVSGALARADCLILCGGLGPTFDDLSREAAAAALGRRLLYRPELYARIRRQYRRYHRRVPESNRRQAELIEGARALPNPNGSAPGQLLTLPGAAGGPPRTVALLPGPFAEMSPMLESKVLPLLRSRYGRGLVRLERVFRFCGISESAADGRLGALLRRPPAGVAFTILAGPGLVELHASAAALGARGASARLDRVERSVRRLMKRHLYGLDSDSLEAAVGRKLLARGLNLAVAESCTGGLLAQRLTEVPGSSAYFLGGLVAYHNRLKMDGLGVRADTLKRHGAVSEACAREMLDGARRAFGAGAAVSITGIAGPGGASPGKPVGLTYIGIALPGRRLVRRFLFAGARPQVRERAATAALALLWRLL